MTSTETSCAAVSAADVVGFKWFEDQRGVVTARCVRCWLGFAVRPENAERMRELMKDHQVRIHRWRDEDAPQCPA